MIIRLFHFGKYKNCIIKDVAEKDPGYVIWCYNHLDHFHQDIDASYPGLIEHCQSLININNKMYDYNEYDMALDAGFTMDDQYDND